MEPKLRSLIKRKLAEAEAECKRLYEGLQQVVDDKTAEPYLRAWAKHLINPDGSGWKLKGDQVEFTRSQQAAIQRAKECEVQTISAFGKTHQVSIQAANLVFSLTSAAEIANEPRVSLDVPATHPKECKCYECGKAFLATHYEPAPPAIERGPV